MKKVLEKIIKYLFYLFVFTFVWQTKLIIIPNASNYNEIALYFNYLLLFLILLFFVFYLAKYKWAEFSESIRFERYVVALAGVEFFAFMSIFVSIFREISIYKYILFLLSMGVFFLMTQFKFDKKKIILIFLIAMLFQASLGTFQFFAQTTFANKYLGLDSHDPSVLGVAVLENQQGRLLRAYGAFDHPNIFGALMFFAVILTIVLILKSEVTDKKKFFYYFLLGVFLLALILSFSRSAILSLLLSLISLLIFFVIKKDKIDLKKYLVVFVGSLLFLLTFFIIFKPLLLDRLNINSRLEKISVSERVEQSSKAGEIIKSNPWLGVGLGAYHQKLLNLDKNLQPYQAQPVHNVFALIWAESGLWALICFILFLSFILIKNYSNYYIYPLFIGLFIFMALDHWLFSLPFGLLLFFFVISLTFDFGNDNVNH